ncbi:MAG: nucleotide exchange factor GrpE [Eubacteriales bacterium]
MAKKEKEVKKETEQTPEVETVSQDQFKQLQESLEALQTELEQVKKAKEEEKDQYMRVLAEYDNYRKRTDREKAATYDSATADTIAQFLPVVDNMELALAQADCSAEDLRKGVQMIQKISTTFYLKWVLLVRVQLVNRLIRSITKRFLILKMNLWVKM